MRKKQVILVIISSLLLSAAAHFFFIQQWLDGYFMIGPNDGLSQMIPFKQFIYEQYSNGNFFYSWAFGLGGGFYSQLAYYFSTSIVFLATAGIVFLLETVQWIDSPDLLFWADIILFVSILRLSFIITAAAFAFRYMGIGTTAAFTGAAVYGLCVMYVRHVIFWEFFTDAMLWLPILVLGTEKIIREGKPGWFIAAWSLMFFNNFYFAYVHLIFLFIYILFRWMIPLSEQECTKRKQLRLFFTAGFISFCISAVSFIPAVYAFFNNHRPAYEAAIPFFRMTDNMLYASKYIILPAILLLFLFTKTLYKERTYKLFAWLTLFLMILHFSPLAASVFNGFSAPQYRWEYVLSFVGGGCVAAGLQSLHTIRIKQLLLPAAVAGGLYLLMAQLMTRVTGLAFEFQRQLVISVLLFLCVVFLLLLYLWKKQMYLLLLLQIGIVLSSLVIVNEYEQLAMSERFGVNIVSRDFLQSSEYNGTEQQRLINQIKKSETDPFTRIDWMIDFRNNTPIVQHFNGTSLYSSIFNEELLFFYWHDLQIDMRRESVSRYATLGNRTNLHSLLQTKYWMRDKQQTVNAPYGFVPFAESERYIVFKNTLPLPFVRTAQDVFYEEDLIDRSPLDKEHAMLSGVVLEKKSGKSRFLPKEKNIIHKSVIRTKNAAYTNDHLEVKTDNGGITMIPPVPSAEVKDYYVHFDIQRMDGSGFALKVNKYRTTRKPASSIYKTGINTVVIRIPAAEKITIQLPQGTYKLKDLQLYEEDYRELHEEAAKKVTQPEVQWDKNKLFIHYKNETKEQYMVLPIPFEKGWLLKINGKRKQIEKANFAFTGIPLQNGVNRIQLVYRPPFFIVSVILTVLGFIGASWLIKRDR
ncbi:YfhO family protein [Bacillus sp. B190/17]|uniref:YfhO family protein n=1 Tax=Bacillus lumedeiriae TaxID=3058829 RepID=A0ABW8ICQ3_9BACI